MNQVIMKKLIFAADIIYRKIIDYHKCNNIIPINSIEDICKECRWKSCHER